MQLDIRLGVLDVQNSVELSPVSFSTGLIIVQVGEISF